MTRQSASVETLRLCGFEAGKAIRMNLRKVIEKSFRREGRGTNVAGGVDAVVSANVGEPGSRSHLSSRSRRRIVQKGGRTIVDEHDHETRESGTQ